MNHIIRTATRADLEAVIGLLVDDVLGAGRDTLAGALDPAYGAAFAAIERDPNQKIAVMEANGRIIGCMQISYLPGLSRKGMWRGQGLGRAFFRARGCGIIQLSTDTSRTDAHRFYLALGFEASHVGMKLKL